VAREPATGGDVGRGQREQERGLAPALAAREPGQGRQELLAPRPLAEVHPEEVAGARGREAGEAHLHERCGHGVGGLGRSARQEQRGRRKLRHDLGHDQVARGGRGLVEGIEEEHDATVAQALGQLGASRSRRRQVERREGGVEERGVEVASGAELGQLDPQRPALG
jgi:hypothetical protein